MESRVKMNRDIYMKSLRARLSKLPREDLEMAMDYFREYFEEAGPENEAQAIEDLGTPRQAADQIIMDLAVKNSEEFPKAEVKRSFSAVWIGILAVFAAPIALPLAFALVAVAGSLGLAVVLVMASLVIAGAAVTAGGVVSVILGAVMIFQSPANAVATMGAGFFCTGIGLLVCPATVALTKKCMQLFVKLFAGMIKGLTKHKKGGDGNNEEKQ